MPRPRSFEPPPPPPLNPRDRTLERLAGRLLDSHEEAPGPQAIAVAVSGGADSVALLHFLAARRKRSGGSPFLAALHVNHRIRGAASDADAAWTRELAESLGIPYFEAALPPGSLPAKGASSLPPEDAARSLRYRALGELAERAGADLVAVAHTADDQAETVLFRMARGAGLKGLSGIAVRARVHGVPVIRPLLPVTREQVLEYLYRNGMDHREDASNQSLDATRNYLRHEVLPRLKERVNPAVRNAFLRQASLFREMDVYLVREARRLLPEVTVQAEEGKIVLDAAAVRRYPKLLRSYVFRCALHDLDGAAREISASHVDVLHSLATQSSGRSADLPMGIRAKRERGRIVLWCRNREPADRGVHPTVETSGAPADSRKGSPAE